MPTQTKIPFRTAYSESIKKHAPAGEEEYPIWEYEINSKGNRELKITGYRNRYEEIQAEKEDCMIENILKRVAIGDMSDFRPDGIYQDVTQIPNNLIDAKREMQKLENLWLGLPLETRAKYNNSVDEFIAKAGEKSWLIDMGYMQPETPNITSEELKVETKVEVPDNE